MYKHAFLHTNNALNPLPEQPEEKNKVPTITAMPSKGQKSNPLKYSDVPAEIKQRYRKLSTEDLGRLVERSGGSTTPKGRIYASVLEERSVNPMLAGKNPRLAKSAPFSVYKTAQYNEAVNTLDKIANMSNIAMQNPNRMHGGPTPNMTKVDDRLGGALGGAIGGAGLGALGGLAAGKGLSRLKYGLAGAGIGSVVGGIYGAAKKPVAPSSSV